jgi:hypothetical protein
MSQLLAQMIEHYMAQLAMDVCSSPKQAVKPEINTWTDRF